MLSLDNVPVIDHHCHPYQPEKAVLDTEQLSRVFFHGMGDIPDPSALKARHWGATQELRYHFPHMGVVGTMICQLAKLFNCPTSLEEVAETRNRLASKDFSSYIRTLYQDAGIVATVLDTDLTADDPLLKMIPGIKWRLFQFEPALNEQLSKTSSYKELLHGFQERLDWAIKADGRVGVKVHLAEQVGFGVEPLAAGEAGSFFDQAKAGDQSAYKKVYVALFTATLLQCQELDVPVHLHSGFTGGLWQGPIHNADPFLLAPFLRRKEFLRTKIILLHAGYPWTKQAGQMAHTFPHLWVDMGQVSPWASLRLVECYRDVMAWAPLSKIVIGSGGHGSPEIAWLAAKSAKIALAEVLNDSVRLGLLDESYAESVGRMILHDNCARLYGLNS